MMFQTEPREVQKREEMRSNRYKRGVYARSEGRELEENNKTRSQKEKNEPAWPVTQSQEHKTRKQGIAKQIPVYPQRPKTSHPFSPPRKSPRSLTNQTREPQHRQQHNSRGKEKQRTKAIRLSQRLCGEGISPVAVPSETRGHQSRLVTLFFAPNQQKPLSLCTLHPQSSAPVPTGRSNVESRSVRMALSWSPAQKKKVLTKDAKRHVIDITTLSPPHI